MSVDSLEVEVVSIDDVFCPSHAFCCSYDGRWYKHGEEVFVLVVRFKDIYRRCLFHVRNVRGFLNDLESFNKSVDTGVGTFNLLDSVSCYDVFDRDEVLGDCYVCGSPVCVDESFLSLPGYEDEERLLDELKNGNQGVVHKGCLDEFCCLIKDALDEIDVLRYSL